MPTIKTVNALSSLAGGIAGGLQDAATQKRQAALDADRQRQQAVDNAFTQSRMNMAQRDQAIQEEIYARNKQSEDAARQGMQLASQSYTPFKSREEQLSTISGKVDPKQFEAISGFAKRKDAADGMLADIDHDLSSGFLDDVQAGPDGKDQRVPNPERQQQAMAIRQFLANGGDPDQAMRAYAPMRADIIGQRSQQLSTQHMFEQLQTQMTETAQRGLDTSEFALAMNELMAARDPVSMMNDRDFQHRLYLARQGLVAVPGEGRTEYQVPPSQAPALRALIIDNFRMKAEAELNAKNAAAEAQAKSADARMMDAETNRLKAENPKPPTEKADANPYRAAAGAGYKDPIDRRAYLYLDQNKADEDALPDDIRGLPIRLRMDVVSQLKKLEGNPAKLRAEAPKIFQRAKDEAAKNKEWLP